MSDNCATRDELLALENRVYNDINSIRGKLDDVCKGQNKAMETNYEIKASTEILKNTINDVKNEMGQFSGRLEEQKTDIIKEITLIALQKEGTELFKNKLQTIIGGFLLCLMGVVIIGMAGNLLKVIVSKIAPALL